MPLIAPEASSDTSVDRRLLDELGEARELVGIGARQHSVPEAEYSFFVGNALRYGWAPAISERFAAVYAALASVAAARLPSFA